MQNISAPYSPTGNHQKHTRTPHGHTKSTPERRPPSYHRKIRGDSPRPQHTATPSDGKTRPSDLDIT